MSALGRGLRRRWKMALLTVAMYMAALEADDETLPARKRQEYGRRVMQFIRWHRRLRALK